MTPARTHVLVVTSDERMRVDVEGLVNQGIVVQWCRAIQEAYENLERQPEDILVIWDASLRNTPEAIRQVHRVRPKAKIVVLSPSPDWSEARECFRAGAVDYLPARMGALELTRVKERMRQWLAEGGRRT